MRKTRRMLRVEEKHGQPIDKLIAAALTEHGTIERAANSLGVNWKTFYGWMRLLRIQTRKVAVIEGKEVA